MVNERPEMLAKSATLYFGPWYRQSPFFKSTLRAGCTAYDIYNHMYLPGLLRRSGDRVPPAHERGHDVGRRRRADRPGGGAGRRPADRHAHLPRSHDLRREAGQVHDRDVAGRRHRERSGAAACGGEHAGGCSWPTPTRGSTRWGSPPPPASTPRSRSRTSTRCRCRGRSPRRRSRSSSARRSTTSSTTGSTSSRSRASPC